MRNTLVILTPGFPINEDDSTCIPDRQIFVRVLNETYPELNTIVLSFQYPNQSGEYRWNGIKVIALGGKNKSGLYRRLTWIRAWRELKLIKSTYNVIGLLSFWFDECAFIGDKFSKKYDIKHYSWLLGQDARPGNKYVYRLMPDGNSLIALSDYLVKEFNKNYGIKPKYMIPGAIDPSLFKAPIATKDIDVLGVGSLIPLKQYAIFIDIIGKLIVTIPGIKAVICGNGSEIDALQNQVKQLDLQHNIVFTGELPNSEVLQLMHRAKVFLHTSKYEGFGIVCLEALYAGAKVISFTKPMDTYITNWHTAENTSDALLMIADILTDDGINYQSVLPYTAIDSAKLLMSLFDQQINAVE